MTAKESPLSSHDRFPLRTAARLTGLTPDLIRAWEKRYGVVQPMRGPRGARLYTQADIDHLGRLAKLVSQGRAIGDIAGLDAASLKTLARSPADGASARRAATPEAVATVLELVERFDLPGLEKFLGDALLALGAARFADEVAHPVLIEVGERWAANELTVAEEHLISAAMRHVIGALIRLRPTESGVALLLSTPAGELHEIGLMLAGLRAVDMGLRTYYLGPNLPADEIISAARRAGIAAVGLSIVNPDNARQSMQEVAKIDDELPPDVELWLGGSECRRLSTHVRARQTLFIEDSASLEFHVRRLRAKLQIGRS